MIQNLNRISSWSVPKICGRVVKMSGSVIEVIGIRGYIGEVCYILGNNSALPAVISGFNGHTASLMPIAMPHSITLGGTVYPTGLRYHIRMDRTLCGRLLNSLGQPLDGKGTVRGRKRCIDSAPPPPLERPPIKSVFPTGIKAIDAFCTLGVGQKIGIFSDPGYGKSTLLTQLARTEFSDINVIALIGERGREVKEFINKLDDACLKKSIFIISTSDEPPASKIMAMLTAVTTAEYFRDENLNVLLLADSLSRYEQALKEIAVFSGEQSGSSLYPSINLSLSRLLERIGPLKRGSVTAVFSGLSNSEGIELNPHRLHSLLDGHIILSNPLESIFDYPAVNITNSLSRVMSSVVSQSHLQAAQIIRKLLKTYIESQDLINLGAYNKGADPNLDTAIQKIVPLKNFIRQKIDELTPFNETVEQLKSLAAG